MKHKRIWILAALLVVVIICGEAGAYMRKQSQTLENEFIPAKIDCRVEETYTSSVKSEIKVQNTSNIDAYLRVRIVSYWITPEGNIVYKASEKISFDENSSYWIEDESNSTYYYRYKVAPNEFTEDLLANGKTIVLREDKEDNTLLVVDILPEAIQAEPSEVVINAWNVSVSDGSITTVN